MPYLIRTWRLASHDYKPCNPDPHLPERKARLCNRNQHNNSLHRPHLRPVPWRNLNRNPWMESTLPRNGSGSPYLRSSALLLHEDRVYNPCQKVRLWRSSTLRCLHALFNVWSFNHHRQRLNLPRRCRSCTLCSLYLVRTAPHKPASACKPVLQKQALCKIILCSSSKLCRSLCSNLHGKLVPTVCRSAQCGRSRNDYPLPASDPGTCNPYCRKTIRQS